MGKVVFDTSMSLDGFMTAADQSAEEPMGAGGLRLMEWVMGPDPRGRELLEGWVANLGASIAGRRTYDTSLQWWVYTFVTDGIERALEHAQAAAGDRDVTVMGGANLGRQYLAAGLVDEIQVHLAPVLFGKGTRMFEDVGTGHLLLEPIEVIETPVAVHLRYRIGRRDD
jgi:RibD C-terminal domain